MIICFVLFVQVLPLVTLEMGVFWGRKRFVLQQLCTVHFNRLLSYLACLNLKEGY